jgi:predicted O-methyltransferase YrrM
VKLAGRLAEAASRSDSGAAFSVGLTLPERMSAGSLLRLSWQCMAAALGLPPVPGPLACCLRREVFEAFEFPDLLCGPPDAERLVLEFERNARPYTVSTADSVSTGERAEVSLFRDYQAWLKESFLEREWTCWALSCWFGIKTYLIYWALKPPLSGALLALNIVPEAVFGLALAAELKRVSARCGQAPVPAQTAAAAGGLFPFIFLWHLLALMGSSPAAGVAHPIFPGRTPGGRPLLGSIFRYFRLQAELFGIIFRDKDASLRRLSDFSLPGIKLCDALALARILEARRPSEILEVGSYLGFSSRWILETSSPWQAKLASIDPDLPDPLFGSPGEHFRRFNGPYLGTRLEAIRAFFAPAAPGWTSPERPLIGADWDRRFDLVFIDGDHSYASAAGNIRAASRLLKPGGCLVLHDASIWPGVSSAIGEASRLGADVRLYDLHSNALNSLLANGIAVIEYASP